MKLDARGIESFLKDPGGAALAVLFGDDIGMIRDRSNRLVRAVAGSLDDPFRVTDLERDGLPRLAEELASRSLMGGRRVVRLRDATDAATSAIAAALERGGEALLVVEAPGLASRSKLRTLAERADRAAAIGCYALEGAALEQAIGRALAELGVAADSEAQTWLASQLGADWGATRAELEKLALYAGPESRIDLATAQACVGDSAGLSLDDALFAAMVGDVAGTDRALELAFADGASAVGVLRGALIHVQRLQRVAALVARGMGASEAVKSLRPPLFFRREGLFLQALRLWPAVQLEAAATRIWEAEQACKRTGTPADILARSLVLGLAQRAAQQRRR